MGLELSEVVKEISGSNELENGNIDVNKEINVNDLSKTSDTSNNNDITDPTKEIDVNNTDMSENFLTQESLDPMKEIKIENSETDDLGNVFKVDGKLLPNNEFKKDVATYCTDENGRVKSWEGKPKLTPENKKNEKEQKEAGGEDRQPDDDGAHLEARSLGGSANGENLVAMRATINRGEYSKVENEITNALKEGKEVKDSGKIFYDGNSKRPSKIERTYEIDGQKKELIIDNVKDSKELLNDLKESISTDDFDSLSNEISDMEADGIDVSVTSIFKEYDKNGNVESITVGYRNEVDGDKESKTFTLRKDD